MDGGIIESMLIGAGVGAGTSLLTGGNPLEGAVKGGVFGGIGGGLGGAGGATGAGTAGSTTPLISAGSATNGIVTNALAGGDIAKGLAINGSMLAGSPEGIPSLLSSAAPASTTPMAGIPGVTSTAVNTTLPELAAAAPSVTAPIAAPSLAGSAPIAGGTPAATAGITPNLYQMAGPAPLSEAASAFTPQAAQAVGQAASTAAPTSLMGDVKEWWGSLTPKEKLMWGAGGSLGLSMLMENIRARQNMPGEEKYKGPLSKFRYDPGSFVPSLPFADGGITSLGGGNIAVGGDPRRNLPPISQDNVSSYGWQDRSNPFTRMASGGISSLGSYSDGGRLLKGPGDGMSDNIPAMIGRKQPARLAEGEFVVPADVVSHLGNGSTDAGAKQLYAMMDKVRRARTGRKAQGREINPRRYMPA